MSTISLNASDHAIKSVTLYQGSTAEVQRTFTLELQAGQLTVDITHLSSSLDPETVHVTGLSGVARLLDVVCHVDSALPQDDRLESDSLRSLLSQKQTLEDEKATREHALDLLASYGRSFTCAQVSPSDATLFFDALSEPRRTSLAAMRQLEDQIAIIKTAIVDERASGSKMVGSTTGRVRLVLAVIQDCTVEFKLTYLVSGARWSPSYDLQVSSSPSGEPSQTVSLHSYAYIAQGTGEDWSSSTSLTLCTAPAPARCVAAVPALPKRTITVTTPASQETPFGNKASTVNSIQPVGSTKVNGCQPAVRPSATSDAVNQDANAPQSVFARLPINNAPLPPRGLSGSSLFERPLSDAPEGRFFGLGSSRPPPSGPSLSSHPLRTEGAGANSPFGNTARTSFFGGSGFAPGPSGPPPAHAARSIMFSEAGLGDTFPAFGAPSTASTTQPGNQSQPLFREPPAWHAFQPPSASSPKPQPSKSSTPGVSKLLRTSVHTAVIPVPPECTPPIPSDGLAHRVNFGIRKLEADFAWVCVPSVRAAAFVECRMVNKEVPRKSQNSGENISGGSTTGASGQSDGEGLWLAAGRVNVFVDEEFVAGTDLEDVPPNAPFACSLGADNALAVSCTRETCTISPPGSQSVFQPALDKSICTDRTTVVNHHPFAVALVVRDVCPVANAGDQGVKVIPNSSRDADWVSRNGEESAFEKKGRIGAGKSVVVALEWEITIPTNQSWEEVTA